MEKENNVIENSKKLRKNIFDFLNETFSKKKIIGKKESYVSRSLIESICRLDDYINNKKEVDNA